MRITYSLNDTMIKCKLAGRECSYMDFKWFFDPAYGNCFIFNSGYNWLGERVPIKRISEAYKEYGLEITLYVGMADSLAYLTSSRGVGAYIRNRTQYPYVSSKVPFLANLNKFHMFKVHMFFQRFHLFSWLSSITI